MSAPIMTRDLAWSAAQDTANAQMRTAGRSKWSPEDYALAVREFDRLWPESRDYTNEPEDNQLTYDHLHQIEEAFDESETVNEFARKLRKLSRQYVRHVDGDPTNHDLDNLEIRSGYADVDPESEGRES